MRLEMGTFPVREIVFGARTSWSAGRLTVDKTAALAAVLEDPRIIAADLDIAAPGESVRIWRVRDVIEPRLKVDGPGVCYPGMCDRHITTVGTGRTHRLGGMDVVEVSSVNWHDSGGDFVERHTSTCPATRVRCIRTRSSSSCASWWSRIARSATRRATMPCIARADGE